MSKTLKRLLTFFIGVPLVLSLVYVNFMYHLPLQIVIGIFAVLGASEFHDMLSQKYKLFSKEIVLILVALLPFSSYIFTLAGLSFDVTQWFFVFEIIFLMAFECFSQKSFEQSSSKIAFSLLIVFYTGFLLTFLSRMALLENSRYVISLFLVYVFMCDSFAWFFGILFGKGTRGVVAASPNKSVVGFAGGIVCATGCGLLFKVFFPSIFDVPYLNLIILGIFTSLAGISGDLVESVFKRSCEVKDSGNLIPGRGGVLDSIDSILVAGPIFYIGYNFLIK
ncbi:phosphatidate cytidylyltransferase [Treponema sp. Marseille-Q3903]|uniref:phosphatidate cytidylyltransferase n=1 Tax=Treponema sp. Marseille-Q3903 TaxID=2766703 RepID=UPI00165228CF|nr:phosphatidate cytidylyltransferase [Treponema sp. Marseille-Q3903]MBC6713653.1 phosphatidate cytidylyltransferase [Treponema sp. Marseille-Q3903]